MLQIYDVSIDHVKNPMFIRCDRPKVSWKLQSDKTDVLQMAYQLVFCGADGSSFDSGLVESSSVVGHSITNMMLSSRTVYDVTITVYDNTGDMATQTISVGTEILPDEWGTAKWIRPEEHISGWAPYLRTKFQAAKVKRAVLYGCGLGISEFYLNGQRLNDAYIDPPQSNYEKMVYYRCFDVTERLLEGGNALAVWLGQGFYEQDRVWESGGFSYGKVCAIARLEMLMEDGTMKVIVSDVEDWKAKYSPISLNNIYGGETYDCRLETLDFADYDGSEQGWMSVVEDETPKGELTICLMPPVRVIRELPAVSVHGVSGKGDGVWVFDIGENIGGTAEFQIPPSPRGAVYVFRFGETLNAQGGVDFRSTGCFVTQCVQQEIYICRGDAEGEVYRPHFCYHGFRYVEVSGIHDFSEGYGMTPKLNLVKGLLLSTDFEKTGEFTCDNIDWDKLYRIMENTYRSNFHGIPEDCPAREKCGWIGDAQLVSDFGLLTYDSASAYVKYLDDIRTTKEIFGIWQMVAPGKRSCLEASPLWGCAQIIIPYNIWKYTGDESVIRDNFDLMKEWVNYQLMRSKEHIISEGLGDWLPIGGNSNPRRMPVRHSSTFMFYEICKCMEEICAFLSVGDCKYYGDLANKIHAAIQKSFYNEETHSYGYLGSDAVALMLDLLPEQEAEVCLKQMVATLRERNYEMPTSMYSNKYLVPLMLKEGYGLEVTEMLFGRNHISYGTMMDDGATTLWEHLDMQAVEERPYDSISSYNHPMHGAFLYACYTHLAGIHPIESGYSMVKFEPYFMEGIHSLSAKVETPYGVVSVGIEGGERNYLCNISIPTGARVCLNERDGYRICVGSKEISNKIILGSGNYCVEYIRI